MLSTYNNRGNELTQLKQPLEAEQQYRLALAIARKTKNKVNEASILRNIVRVQIQSGQLVAAERTLATAKLVDPSADSDAPQSSYLALAAQLAFERGNAALAGRAISHYFTGIDLAKTDLSDRDAHETAYKAFLKLGSYDLALRHLEALKRLDDKTASLTASANTALKAADFDAANKDAKIANLKADEARSKFEFEQARSRMLGWIFAGVIVATLIVVSMLIFGIITIRRSRNEVRAANVDLAHTNTALEKALAAKTEFLATTSHEIRTPLNGILGMTQVMLADGTLSAATRDRLGVVHGAGVTMKALVDDILDVAKMETGNLTIEAVPVDLRKTLGDVSRLWEEQARAKGVAFKLDLESCPQLIIGDAARLRQVVFNLLSNALKFTATGAIDLRATRTDDGKLSISVRDTGIGIPADKLEEIFESFKQVDAGTTRQFGGTGLGLSICRNLARAMGGDVSVTSAIGVGSTFAITLPYEPAVSPDAAPTVGVSAAELLIVDRNPISRSMLRALLTPHAESIAVAESLASAIDSIASASPRLVLVDEAVVCAEDDADAALAAIMRAAAAVQARVNLLWPNPTEDERAHFAAAGVDRVIAKPVAGLALVACLYPSADQATGAETPPLVSRAA
ncbi:MAG: hybrid sensor histidine kinase/response regulator [Sphingomonas sp.]|nr:hybrid sensor histidine kinase/response regulator [Sphingomonas sp.]